MANYTFSSNPNVVFNPNAPDLDKLVIDTTSASKVGVSQVGANVVITNGTNTATLQSFMREGIASTDITFTDGSVLLVGADDRATGTDAGDNNLLGGAGNDQLIGLGGKDTLDGGAGNDVIYGNQGDDRVQIGAAASGNDTVFGGQGNDSVSYFTSTAPQLIYGNLGNDTLTGGNSMDSVYGGQGNDFLGAGFDTVGNILNGGAGRDVLTGGSGIGNDTMFGGLDDDSINGGSGSDLIYGNQGSDFINTPGSTPGNDTIYGGQGDDAVVYSFAGATDDNLIYGNFGNDRLYGGSGKDTIFGGQDNDTIYGGAGIDSLSGGAGNDTFLFAPAHSGNTTETADVVADFVASDDKIDQVTAGSTANYIEYGDATVTSVETAVTSYNNAGPAALYTFIAGATNGYLIVDGNSNGTIEADDEIYVLNGLNATGGFDFGNIV